MLLIRMTRALLIAIVSLCCVAGTGSANNLAVTRHIGSSITNAEAGKVLGNATSILQSNHCDASLELSPGSISVFTTPVSGQIDGPEDFDLVCKQPGYVHLVLTIHYCYNAKGDILGCSLRPGKCMVLVRDDSDIEGILWAHEYGHTKGLPHRDNDPQGLMNTYLGTTKVRINKTECSSFKGTNLNLTGAGHLRLASAQVSAESQSSERPNVTEFVHRRYFEGIPYEIASSYSSHDAITLLNLLEKPDEKPFLPNIVTTLGMIGDPVAVDPLVKFVERGEGPIDSPMLRAKTGALIALGYIVNRSKDNKALAYLAQGINPKNWADRKLQWKIPGQEKPEQQSVMLVKSSILGLGLSGTEEAQKILESAQFQIDFAGQPEMNEDTQRALKRALDLNRTILKIGLKSYYQQTQMR